MQCCFSYDHMYRPTLNYFGWYFFVILLSYIDINPFGPNTFKEKNAKVLLFRGKHVACLFMTKDV